MFMPTDPLAHGLETLSAPAAWTLTPTLLLIMPTGLLCVSHKWRPVSGFCFMSFSLPARPFSLYLLTLCSRHSDTHIPAK